MPFEILEGPDGKPVTAKGTADGFLRVVVESGGGGGGGDASAAKQDEQTALLTTIATAADVPTSDVVAAIELLGDGATIAQIVGSLATDAGVQNTILAELQAQGVDVDTSATKLVEIETAVDDLEAIATAARLGADPTWEISRSDAYNGKSARNITIVGRRTSFVNANVLHDIGMHTMPVLSGQRFGDMTGTEALEVVSSNAADSAAGTGVRTVKITYIDALSGDVEAQTTITMNGTTAVALGAGVRTKSIQRLEAATVGSNNEAVGNITLRTVAVGDVWEMIPSGDTRSLSARYMVPAGYTAYLLGINASARAQAMDIELRANMMEDGTGVSHYIQHNAVDLSAGTVSGNIALPLHKFPAGTRIKWQAAPGAVTGSPRVQLSFTILVIQN